MNWMKLQQFHVKELFKHYKIITLKTVDH